MTLLLQQITTGFMLGSIYVTVAVAFTLTIGVLNFLNFTIPAIFMTAKVQPNEIQEYLDMGAIDVIAKPFDPMTLASQIEAIWQRSQG